MKKIISLLLSSALLFSISIAYAQYPYSDLDLICCSKDGAKANAKLYTPPCSNHNLKLSKNNCTYTHGEVTIANVGGTTGTRNYAILATCCLDPMIGPNALSYLVRLAGCQRPKVASYACKNQNNQTAKFIISLP